MKSFIYVVLFILHRNFVADDVDLLYKMHFPTFFSSEVDFVQVFTHLLSQIEGLSLGSPSSS